jgi:hypothetical protein
MLTYAALVWWKRTHLAASVQQWHKKIWLCSLNDDLKIEKLINSP